MAQRVKTWVVVPSVAVVAAVCVACAHDGRARAPAPGGWAKAYGYIDVDCDADEYLVLLSGGGTTVELESDRNPAKVPVERYTLVACAVRSEDARGAPWRLVNKRGKAGAHIEVAPNETTGLLCGPPLTASLVAQRGAGSVAFKLALVGQGGLEYSARDIRRAGDSLAAPGITIRDAQGDVVARGVFEYG